MTSPTQFTLEKLYDLNGLVALVTGGGTGIGLMIAQGLAANGARVYITGRRLEVLQKVAQSWNASKSDTMGSLITLQMDTTNKDDIRQAVQRLGKEEGKLHILVNNAGQSGPLSPELNKPSPSAPKKAEEISQYLFNTESFEEWSALYAVNTFSVYFMTVAFLELLDKGSQDKPGFTSNVINITSISGLVKLAQRHFCYNSSKAAASHLTKMLSTEFALRGIPVRVNAIAPGVYESEMTHAVISGQEATDAVGMGILSVPAKRPGTAAEMAGTAVYLASPAAAYMNGQELVIDGGYTAVNPSRTKQRNKNVICITTIRIVSRFPETTHDLDSIKGRPSQPPTTLRKPDPVIEMTQTLDCIVVGGGHAGASAAIAAIEAGCRGVLIVEKAPKEWVGGNGYFTAGAHRTVHTGLADLLPILTNVTPDQAKTIDVAPYTADEFVADIMRLGENKPNAGLVQTMVAHSREAIQWLAETVRVPFILAFHRQAYEVDGRHKFWGGVALSVEGGGKGLIAADLRALEERGVKLWFDTPAIRLIKEDNAVTGVVVRRNSEEVPLKASAVILACGGYESSQELRMKHLGVDWKHARVRGTPYNTGDGILMAQAVGAKLVGDWRGCHSTCWDANAPVDSGNRELSNQFTKSGYPLGIMVNINGERFVDEGLDFRNYTYAKFGRQILTQPEGCVFQMWDTNVVPYLRREEYGDDVVEKITASSIDALADRLADKGLRDKEGFLRTVREYNDAVRQNRVEHPDSKWDPSIKDGLSTQSSKQSLSLPKSNWALPIEEAPFLAVKVACGITFTFGGLAIDPETAGVLSETGEILRGLFCTGEMVGDLYYNNYPGGSGLTAGTVFGMKAGQAAARLASAKTRKVA
ncbi:hypothetical protein JVU11DRAFT_3589 [Chiua virens]|nr:hypothetical protein JVU11DRAFT_3589 [Chiua virens]